MEIEFHWHGGAMPELEPEMANDIRAEMPNLKRAENILMHIYSLGQDHDGPCITMWGKKDDHRVHCEYSPVFTGMKFHIDDIPGMREKLVAAGCKFDEDEE